MDQVFNHLIKRATPQPVIKVGTPWQCIPIKNDKQARDTEEAHLADQGINSLAGFDKFMNLEVVWLNGNQVLPPSLSQASQLQGHRKQLPHQTPLPPGKQDQHARGAADSQASPDAQPLQQRAQGPREEFPHPEGVPLSRKIG